MKDNYAEIVQNNLDRLFTDRVGDLAANLPGKAESDGYAFEAFGERCLITPTAVRLGDTEHASVFSILLTLYALHANPEQCELTPLSAFKEFPGSMPYAAAFATHTEHLLVPHVAAIKERADEITARFNGHEAPAEAGGDFSFVVFPLPKIALCYIFYEADDDFPASVTCLYSRNANVFMPIDGLADVGEYTSRKILELLG